MIMKVEMEESTIVFLIVQRPKARCLGITMGNIRPHFPFSALETAQPEMEAS